MDWACVFRRGIGLLVTCGFTSPIWALDLLTCYENALQNDAEYQAARATADAGREILPMARAQLLPNLSANATRMENDLTSQTTLLGQSRTENSRYPSRNYALILRQPIYRPAQYAGYLQAQARVESSEASLESAGQDLGLRVATAYFNVLLSEDILVQLEVQGRAIETQLAAAQRALEAGQGTRTDIDDAQSKLDMNRARQLGARQQILQTRHELTILIDQPVDKLQALSISRLMPQEVKPAQLETWIERAGQSNPDLRDLRARIEIARQEVARAEAGHKPTLDLVVQKTISESDNVTNPDTRYDNKQVGIQLGIPLFAGGYVNAQVRQAQATLTAAELQFEAQYRKLATQVRKEFQGVTEGAEQILALEMAERSTQQSLHSNEKGFIAGTRSRIDILNANEALATSRLELSRTRLRYVMSHVRLLSLCGGLGRDAIAEINRWLAD